MSLTSTVIEFSSRLKMLDPVLALSGDTEKDPVWLGNLKQLCNSLMVSFSPCFKNVIHHAYFTTYETVSLVTLRSVNYE